MKSFSMPSAQEMGALIDFCTVMAKSPFYQKLGPGGVMAIYLTAKEYDLPFMACLNGGLHTFDGKVTFSALMIDSLILKAGHKTKVLHIDEKSCKIRFTRGDRERDTDYEPFEYEYTLEHARIAGYLSKKNWLTSPKDMLYARCLTGGGRKHIPEIFVGVLVAGELVGTQSDEDATPLTPPIVAQQIAYEKPKVLIDEEKVKELDLLLDDCMQEYQDKVWTSLNKSGIKKLEELTEDLYHRIKSASIKQIEKQKQASHVIATVE